MESRFYCKTSAFNPEEGARHKEMTNKLVSSWKSFVETKDGYKFLFSSTKVTLAELNEWASNERKCCPFFAFRIDSEREGSVLCLQLSGEEGVKPFIRSEFLVR
jgi:hypothetical protein